MSSRISGFLEHRGQRSGILWKWGRASYPCLRASIFLAIDRRAAMYLTNLNERANRSMRARTRLNGAGITMKGCRLWTSEEEEVLRAHYPDFQRIQSELPTRTRKSLWIRCQKIGLKKVRHRWLSSEISKLKRLYRTEPASILRATFPGLTRAAITSRANYYGITRNSRPHRRTGKAVMDAILSRIEEIRWTLRDLDEAAGTRDYFQSHRWRQCRLNFQMIESAVTALDGELKVSWKLYD
ncbi:hypothetical protein SRABI05_00078 [Agrobacterium fabrum]|nr:hypothetical protein SRABI05_00078 [Agrobacterium fabrum]CAH0151843.1 hypothetical protein SRABI46_00793 [Agrobacterium fabrum]